MGYPFYLSKKHPHGGSQHQNCKDTGDPNRGQFGQQLGPDDAAHHAANADPDSQTEGKTTLLQIDDDAKDGKGQDHKDCGSVRFMGFQLKNP